MAKMKNSITLYLTGFLLVFISSCDNADKESFAIANINAVEKILITGKEGEVLKLNRQDGSTWILNDSLKPRPDFLNTTLQTLQKMEKVHPVSKSRLNHVMKIMNTASKKVEVFGKSEMLLNTYYLGGVTQNLKGTYVLRKGDKVPYVAKVPGLKGHLEPAFNTAAVEWKNRKIFDSNSDEIQMVQVSYPLEKKDGYRIEKTGADFKLFAIDKADKVNAIPEIDKVAISEAFRHCDKLFIESFEESFSKKDSVLTNLPFAEIDIENIQGQKESIEIYYMPITERSKFLEDQYGNKIPYDVDHFFALYQGEFIMIQNYLFRAILKQAKDFTSKK